jgi:hypothetical protein
MSVGARLRTTWEAATIVGHAQVQPYNRTDPGFSSSAEVDAGAEVDGR